MKSYLEIKVPINKNEVWLKELKKQFSDTPVRWQDGYYHITMAFLYDTTSELQARAKQTIDNVLSNVGSIPMAFDKVDAFTATSGEMHIINLTSESPNMSFLKLIDEIRSDLSFLGLKLESGFILHVTLGRILATSISIEELKARLSYFTIPSFTLNLFSLEYRVFRGKIIGKWHLC